VRGIKGLDFASKAVEAPADIAMAAPTKCRRFIFIDTIPGWVGSSVGLQLTLSITIGWLTWAFKEASFGEPCRITGERDGWLELRNFAPKKAHFDSRE
jgi:hypothetical protein